MSASSRRILQIVPQLPGTGDGVGDYALNLARSLATEHGVETLFAVARKTAVTEKEGFPVLSGLETLFDSPGSGWEHAVLHYVNYGYQPRGVPTLLHKVVQRLRPQLRGRWLTTFHEIYASGPPWKSAFWVRPFQVRIAHAMIDASTVCVVSNPAIERAIHAHDAAKKVYTVPVMSNFGEPAPAEFATAASPKRWVICGGTALIAQ